MNTIPSGIGTRIRDARKAAGMSQTVLGQHLNKTLRTIQKYESGEIEPSIALSFGEGVCAYREVEETPQDQLYKLHHPIRSFFMKITKRKDS